MTRTDRACTIGISLWHRAKQKISSNSGSIITDCCETLKLPSFRLRNVSSTSCSASFSLCLLFPPTTPFTMSLFLSFYCSSSLCTNETHMHKRTGLFGNPPPTCTWTAITLFRLLPMLTYKKCTHMTLVMLFRKLSQTHKQWLNSQISAASPPSPVKCRREESRWHGVHMHSHNTRPTREDQILYEGWCKPEEDRAKQKIISHENFPTLNHLVYEGGEHRGIESNTQSHCVIHLHEVSFHVVFIHSSCTRSCVSLWVRVDIVDNVVHDYWSAVHIIYPVWLPCRTCKHTQNTWGREMTSMKEGFHEFPFACSLKHRMRGSGKGKKQQNTKINWQLERK
jgi:hypothetical protein